MMTPEEIATSDALQAEGFALAQLVKMEGWDWATTTLPLAERIAGEPYDTIIIRVPRDFAIGFESEVLRS